jgi:UDP-N-acetylmuramoylalanine--D-glutamate ligase
MHDSEPSPLNSRPHTSDRHEVLTRGLARLLRGEHGDAPRPLAALIIGLGKSGIAVAKLLRAIGVEVRLYDRDPNATSRLANDPLLAYAAPGAASVTTYFGGDAAPAQAHEGLDLVVLSPGVPPGPHREAAARFAPGCAIEGEMSLSLKLAALAWGRLPTVLVTGTNGKSTVTAMTGALLDAAGLHPFVGGNLDVPLADRVASWLVQGELGDADDVAPGALVLECSSYQLETMHDVPCDVAMLLNLTPDHLDRYLDMAGYGATKANVFTGLADDGIALLEASDPWCHRLAPANDARVRFVDGDAPPRVTSRDGRTWLDLCSDEAIDRDVLRLAGAHNARNALFALSAARHLGVSLATCERGLADFGGLPHRMVFVVEHAGVAFFDDSKATNVASVLASVNGFPRPFVLIAGGRAKGDDLSPLREVLLTQGRGLVALGESAQQFLDLADGVVPTAHASSIEEATRLAFELARPGEAVVLSPACASWDMFSSYAERGRRFAEAARGLAAAGAGVSAPFNR